MYLDFRNGHEEFFSTLEAMNVPLVLFSAGLGGECLL